MGVRQQAPTAIFPRPQEQYEAEEESQFRQSVERAIQEVVGYLTDARTGTPAALASGDNDDYAIGVSDFLRLSANGAGSAITGLDEGRSGRKLVVVNLANTLTLEHEDAASAAENRIITATGAAISLAVNDMAELIYDEISARWRVMGTAV